MKKMMMKQENFLKAATLITIAILGQSLAADTLAAYRAIKAQKMSVEAKDTIMTAILSASDLKAAGAGHNVLIVTDESSVAANRLINYQWTDKGVPKTTTSVQRTALNRTTGEVEEAIYTVPDSISRPIETKVENLTYFELQDGKPISTNPHSAIGESVKRVELPGVTRTYDTPSGRFEEGMGFEVVDKIDFLFSAPQFHNKPMRIQTIQTLKSPNTDIVVARTPTRGGDLLKIFLESRRFESHRIYQGVFQLNAVEGVILKFHVNAIGSKLSVWTSKGEKLEYDILADNKALRFTKVNRSKVENLLDFDAGIADIKRIGKREATVGSARGMQVEAGGAQ